MRAIVAGLATAAAMVLSSAGAAQAQRSAGSGDGGVSVHRGAVAHGGAATAERKGGERHWKRERRRDRTYGYPIFYGGYGYYEDNASWQPDSYNDWWHERPERSLPRWVTQNRNCERIWWSGGVWRC